MIDTTLCYIEKDGAYLMLLRNKKKVDCNKGKWIGVGGKFEPGEDAYRCVLREVREETGMDLSGLPVVASPNEYGLHYYGLIEFFSDGWEPENMYLFSAKLPGKLDSYEIACDEGELHWIAKEKILELNLWEGDVIFLKDMLEGKASIGMTLRYKNDRLDSVTRRDGGVERQEV